MFTRHYHFPLPTLAAQLFAGLVSFTSPAAGASTRLAYFDFDQGDTFELAADSLHTALAGADFNLSSGSLTDFSGNPGRALGANGFVARNTLQLRLTPAPGWRLALESLQFDLRVSPSGPNEWWLNLNGIEVGRADTSTSFQTIVLDTASAPPPAGSAWLIEFNAAGAASALGTLRIDNFVIDGQAAAVPIPGTLLLLAPPLWLIRRQRSARSQSSSAVHGA